MSRPHRIRRNSMDESSDEEYIPTSHTNGRRTNSFRLTRQRELRGGSFNSENEYEAKRAVVQHHYHDHRTDPIEVLDEQNQVKAPRGPRGGVTVAFPEKLHEMLSALTAEGREDIISWQPHGRSFLVHEKKKFVEDVMPRFFHQSKLTSFQRQLNLYGFVRLTAGRDRGGYYHELFLRGRPDLCRRIARTRIKGNGMKAASSPNTEPNFYAMKACLEDDPEMPVVVNPISQTESNGLRIKEVARQPYLVSPPPSPQMSSLQTNANYIEALAPSIGAGDTNIYRMEYEDRPPRTGDVAFFEGHKFRYLDHFDLMDVIGAFEEKNTAQV